MWIYLTHWTVIKLDEDGKSNVMCFLPYSKKWSWCQNGSIDATTHVPSQVCKATVCFLYLCSHLPQGPVLAQCSDSEQTLNNLVWWRVEVLVKTTVQSKEGLWVRDGVGGGVKEKGKTEINQERNPDKEKSTRLNGIASCAHHLIHPVLGCAQVEAPVFLSVGVSLTPAWPPELMGPGLVHLHCGLFILQLALLSFPSAMPPNNHHPFEKLLLGWLRRSHKALNHHCPLLLCSVASASCFPFQRQFRICFYALSPEQWLPLLPTELKSAVTLSLTHCLPETGCHW